MMSEELQIGPESVHFNEVRGKKERRSNDRQRGQQMDVAEPVNQG